MEFTDGAKTLIEGRLKEITGDISLSGEDRAEIEKELRSSFYESAESKAKERGSAAVTVEDARETLAAEGAPGQIATCYMKSYASHLRRAGLLYRTIAYLIDSIAIAFCMSLLMIPLMLLMFMWGEPRGWMVAVVILYIVSVVLTAIGFIISYFVVAEGYSGRTFGKYVMGLKVLKTDGTKISYREAALRNIPKFVGNFIFIDALLMLIFFNKEKQRAFDKVADTIVVHTR